MMTLYILFEIWVILTFLKACFMLELGGGGVSPPPPPNVADWVGQTLIELDHQKWPTLIFCLIKEFELIKPQHWLTEVGQTSTLTDSSRSNLDTDRLESVKPQHWPTRVGQTSTLTDSSRSNLSIDRLESVKPQHQPTRVGQICFYTPPPPNHIPLEPSLARIEYLFLWILFQTSLCRSQNLLLL